jgi:hypothetical protein
MQYAWYEIVGYGLLTAFLIWIMFQGLEWGLDILKDRRERKALDELNRTAPPLPVRVPKKRECPCLVLADANGELVVQELCEEHRGA